MPAKPRGPTTNTRVASLPISPGNGRPVCLAPGKRAQTIANTATTGRLVGSDDLEPTAMFDPFTLDRFDHGERR